MKSPENLLRTPLCLLHEQEGARMIDFGGWWMPVQYAGIVAEHRRTRAAVSVFDTCHMGQIRIEGPAALEDLRALLTTDVATLAPGRCRYGFLTNPRGGVVDDLITYRLADTSWMLVVNAATRDGDLAWIAERVSAGTTVTPRFATHGKIDVQGPAADETLEALLDTGPGGLKRFGFRETSWQNRPLIVSRTGYTGENGYELYADNETIVALWTTLREAGVEPAGLGARDTLRLEAGLPLYGHELTAETSPIAAGLDRFVCLDNPFPGRDELARQQREGTPRKLRGLRIDGRQTARHGHTVKTAGGAAVGGVTSGSFSPTLGSSIAMAYIDVSSSEEETAVRIDTGRRELDASVTNLPFYKRR